MAKCQEQHRNQSCAAIRKAPYQVAITSEWKTLWLGPRIMKELCLSWARNFVYYVEYLKIFHWNSIFEHDWLIYSTNIYVMYISFIHDFADDIITCSLAWFAIIWFLITLEPYSIISALIWLLICFFTISILLEDRLHDIYTLFDAIIIIFNTLW